MHTKPLITALLCLSFFLFQIAAFPQNKGGRWQFENNGLDTAEWDSMDDPGNLQGQALYRSEDPLQEGNTYLYLDTAFVHDYFRLDDSDDLDFDNENIALSAWIYPVVSGDDVHYILNKGDQFPNPKSTNYALRISKTKKLEFLIRDTNNQAQTVASRFTIPENIWTFVGIFYNYALGTVYMWNDSGSGPADTLEFHQDFFSNGSPLAIGSWYTSNPALPSVKDFEGRIDDVRIGTQISHIIDGWTSIAFESHSQQPGPFRVHQNYPNPFNNQTVIAFDVDEGGDLILDILDLQGRTVTRMFRGYLESGHHHVTLNGSDMVSGYYFIRLRGSDRVDIRKMVLLK